MAAELCYTSSRQGLFPPAHGFCTVAATAGLSTQDIEQLEGLSGYRPRFGLDHPQSDRNPVAFGHTLIGGGRGGPRSVLTRAAHAGADYTGRNNKFVHHLLLDPTNPTAPTAPTNPTDPTAPTDRADRAEAGPAWMLAQPGLMRTGWDDAPETLHARPDLPAGDAPPAACDAWQRAAGDAGWAGVLAEWHLLNPAAPAWLVYDPDRHDPLALTAESIALLPPAHRWSVTFSTYFTDTPGGAECAWRWVIAGTAAAEALQTSLGDRLIDLTRPLGPAHDSRYVHAARSGGPVVEPEIRSVRPSHPPTTPEAPTTPGPSPPRTAAAALRSANAPLRSARARRTPWVTAAILLPIAGGLVAYTLLPDPQTPDPAPPRLGVEPDSPPPAPETINPPTPDALATHEPAATTFSATPPDPVTEPVALGNVTPPAARPAAAPPPPTPDAPSAPPAAKRSFTDLPAPHLEAGASAGLGRLARLHPQETLLTAIDPDHPAARVTARSAADPAAPLRLAAQGNGVVAQLHRVGPLGQPQVQTLGEAALTDRGLVWRWHAEPFASGGAAPTLDDLHDLVRLAVFTATDAQGQRVAEAQGLVPERVELRPGDAARPLPDRLDTADPRFELRHPATRWALSLTPADPAGARLHGAGGTELRLHRGSHLAARWGQHDEPSVLAERFAAHQTEHAELTSILDAHAPLRDAADTATDALPKTPDDQPDYALRDQSKWKQAFDHADKAENKLEGFLANDAPDGIDAVQTRVDELAAALDDDRARRDDQAQLDGVVLDLVAHRSGARLAEITLKGDTP